MNGNRPLKLKACLQPKLKLAKLRAKLGKDDLAPTKVNIFQVMSQTPPETHKFVHKYIYIWATVEQIILNPFCYFKYATCL